MSLDSKNIFSLRESLEIEKNAFPENSFSSCRILFVEDNDFVRNVIKKGLEADRYAILEAPTIQSARNILQNYSLDLILLDIHLPDGDGLKFMSEIRHHTDVPIIIVSSRDEMVDKVLGLELGADDYVNKSVEMRELSARVKANIRRYRNDQKNLSQQTEPTRIKFNNWTMDFSKYQIFCDDGESGNLTVKEFQLLEAFVRAPGQVLTRDHLFSIVRDENSDTSDRAVDVQIARIRKKIGDCAKSPQIIKTVRGIGYIFEGK